MHLQHVPLVALTGYLVPLILVVTVSVAPNTKDQEKVERRLES